MIGMLSIVFIPFLPYVVTRVIMKKNPPEDQIILVMIVFSTILWVLLIGSGINWAIHKLLQIPIDGWSSLGGWPLLAMIMVVAGMIGVIVALCESWYEHYSTHYNP